ncbi:hypothetical protein [Actinacidiphila glaucinigra]|uniref:hypothetical protein n=1 Tax=Actinacidiphila glaucinigra TaxID=235986 RepID=UPI003D8A6D65
MRLLHEQLTNLWSRRGLAALALSGGLLPSPSAFLIFVSGLLTLTGVGVATIRGFAIVQGRFRGRTTTAKLRAWIPVVAGLAVVVAGSLYIFTAVSTLQDGDDLLPASSTSTLA